MSLDLYSVAPDKRPVVGSNPTSPTSVIRVQPGDIGTIKPNDRFWRQSGVWADWGSFVEVV